MKPLVMDASVLLAWCYNEKGIDNSAIMACVDEHGIVVPSLFFQECVNSFALGFRTKRFSKEAAELHFEEMMSLSPEVDEALSHDIIEDIFRLSLRHQITSYDATYLELARRKKLPLATLDKSLRAAAKKEKVAVLA